MYIIDGVLAVSQLVSAILIIAASAFFVILSGKSTARKVEDK